MFDLLLIDGDILVYKCAFSAETVNSYFLEDGARTPISNLKDARKEQKDKDIVRETLISPEFVAIGNLESMIKRILSQVKHKEYRVVLSNNSKEVNKRNKIAKQIPYKVDRPPKPFHYNALREHLISVHNAHVVEEGEADDYLGQAQQGSTIIASIDKDLLQIPGSHFNIDDSSIIRVDPLGELHLDETNKLTGTGFKWFCAQCLLGDRTDAIKGIPYIRQTRVHQLLVGAETEESCWERVKKEYLENKKVPLWYLGLEESEEQARIRYLKEMAQLVWIAHSDSDYYLPNIDGVRIV